MLKLTHLLDLTELGAVNGEDIEFNGDGSDIGPLGLYIVSYRLTPR